MEAEPTLVRANSAVKFHTKPFVYLDYAVIVNPWHSKKNGALRLRYAVQNTLILIAGMTPEYRLQRPQNLPHSLVEFWLIGVLLNNGIQNRFDI
jgi:hypothetical protein